MRSQYRRWLSVPRRRGLPRQFIHVCIKFFNFSGVFADDGLFQIFDTAEQSVGASPVVAAFAVAGDTFIGLDFNKNPKHPRRCRT